MTEISLFFRAVSAKEKEHLSDAAMASRLGQTTEQSYKEFNQTIRASINSLIKGMKKLPSGEQVVRRGDDALSSLFGQVLKTDSKKQVVSKTIGELKNANT